MVDPIVALATLPAIVALVNLAKRLGLDGKAALVLAVVLGVGLSVADYSFAGQGWYAAATSGLILGLGASGLYDLAPTSTFTTATFEGADLAKIEEA